MRVFAGAILGLSIAAVFGVPIAVAFVAGGFIVWWAAQ